MGDALVLGFGSHLAATGAVSATTIIAFLLYLDQFFSPIQQLSQVFDQWQQARASLLKIDELLTTPSSTPVAARPTVPDRLSGRVSFDDVHFRYAAGAPEALRGIDLEVRPGETVALVGETGAGKSTLVKLVARFYDATSGVVSVDGTPIPALDLTAYRRRLGYVPQEPFLFTGTIRDNIAYGRPDATPAEVEAASRAVGAHELVTRLPGGYLAPVTERGRSLSAGERQLICLARALLVDPAILLLDEATANLDLATEAAVQRAMGAVAEERTTLLIAHRLPTARGADRIVVVDGGRVVEQGDHESLLARWGRLRGHVERVHAGDRVGRRRVTGPRAEARRLRPRSRRRNPPTPAPSSAPAPSSFAIRSGASRWIQRWNRSTQAGNTLRPRKYPAGLSRSSRAAPAIPASRAAGRSRWRR